jgi:hypothetical protein
MINAGMKNKTKNAVAGVRAPSVRPTPLGAALAAAIITFPIAVTILFVDLLLL